MVMNIRNGVTAPMNEITLATSRHTMSTVAMVAITLPHTSGTPSH